jgi:uncharacterized protein (TIGR03437 family)
MSYKALVLCCAVLAAAELASPQTTYFPLPARVLGQASPTSGSAPNRVEGREFSSPGGIALDMTATPPIIYVSDTGNNRVLGWRNSAGFTSGDRADIVIGQPDFLSTGGNNPGVATGLSAPMGLAVDSQGNLLVLDAGNNRILRYPRPFDQSSSPLSDVVIGQPNKTSRTYNQGGGSTPGPGTLHLYSGSTLYTGSLFVDTAGNLWVTDGGNHRVLRFPAAAIGRQNPEADLVLGQASFTSATAALLSDLKNNVTAFLSRLKNPSAVTIDSAGHVFVSDGLDRVLVFMGNPLVNGQAAARAAGSWGLSGTTIVTPIQPPTAASFFDPEGLAMVGDELVVADRGNNRVLRFPAYSAWPASGSSQPIQAKSWFGQQDLVTAKPSVSSSGLHSPLAVAWSGSEMFIADYSNNRVIVVPGTSQYAIRVLGQLGLDYDGVNLVEGREMYFPGASGVVIDTKSNPPHLYVADPGNNRVLAWCDARKANDKADLAIGQPDLFRTDANWPVGSAPTEGSLSFPTGLALDQYGNLFVADTNNSRVLRFPNPFNNPCGQPQASGTRANLVLGQHDANTRVTDPTSQTMAAPYGVAVTPDGHVLASDAAHNRILLFKKPANNDFTSGQAAAMVFGQPDFSSTASGSDDNRMNSPRHIASDTSGRLYVADYGNNRVLIFGDVPNVPLNTSAVRILTAATSTATLQKPIGIYVRPETGEIYASEAGSPYRVVRFAEFSNLILNSVGSLVFPSGTNVQTLALTLNDIGTIFAADAAHRIAMYAAAADVYNGASFVKSAPLAPGLLATLKGDFGAPEPQSTGLRSPMQTTLADIQLLVNGVPAPLNYVGKVAGLPDQINFQVPQNAPQSGNIDIQVQRASTGQILAAAQASMRAASPAFFQHWPYEDSHFSVGQIAALNHGADGTITCNGAVGPPIPGFCPDGIRPARTGEYVELYLTGQGRIPNMPEDGGVTPSSPLVTTDNPNLIVVVNTAKPTPTYSGLAPNLVGVWQVNVQVPTSAISCSAPPCKVPVGLSYRDISTVPGTFIMVQ